MVWGTASALPVRLGLFAKGGEVDPIGAENV